MTENKLPTILKRISTQATSPLAKQGSSDEGNEIIDDLFDKLECNGTESDYSIELEENSDKIFSKDEKEESLKNKIESNLSSLKNIDKRVQNLDEKTHVIEDKLKNIYKEQEFQFDENENEEISIETSVNQINKLKEDLEESNQNSRNMIKQTDKMSNLISGIKNDIEKIEKITFVSKLQLREQQSEKQLDATSVKRQ